jgi:hypothetical protein
MYIGSRAAGSKLEGVCRLRADGRNVGSTGELAKAQRLETLAHIGEKLDGRGDLVAPPDLGTEPARPNVEAIVDAVGKKFVSVLYRSPDGFYAGPNVEWSPKRYPVDMANSLYADSYAVLGLKVGQVVKQGLSWFVDARNLTDRNYAATQVSSPMRAE